MAMAGSAGGPAPNCDGASEDADMTTYLVEILGGITQSIK